MGADSAWRPGRLAGLKRYLVFFVIELQTRRVHIAGIHPQPGGAWVEQMARTLTDPVDVLPKLSQETLAEMVGTTRSRVNFFMNKFRKLGFIRYNGGLKVNSSLLSVVLHD